MPNASIVCGNCGKDVAVSDVTCPHCGVLLAAYASPEGSTTAHMYESSEPIADAVPEAEMYIPDPAPPIVIPDKVEVASTAPRPLFDTQLTVEEITKAAEGDHEESLVVVSEKKIHTKPKVFDVPSYARPPADAAPVQILDGGDEDMIARATEAPAESGSPQPTVPARLNKQKEPKPTPAKTKPPERPKQPSYSQQPVSKSAERAEDEAESTEPEGRPESWLYDLSKSGPAAQPHRTPRKQREAGRQPEPTRTTTLAPGKKRGSTEDYLRKLHDETGYDSDLSQLSEPMETRSGGTGWTPGMSTTRQAESLKKSRKGCLNVLYIVLAFMWLGIILRMLSGNFNTGLFMTAVVLSFLARFLNKPLPGEKRR